MYEKINNNECTKYGSCYTGFGILNAQQFVRINSLLQLRFILTLFYVFRPSIELAGLASGKDLTDFSKEFRRRSFDDASDGDDRDKGGLGRKRKKGSGSKKEKKKKRKKSKSAKKRRRHGYVKAAKGGQPSIPYDREGAIKY